MGTLAQKMAERQEENGLRKLHEYLQETKAEKFWEEVEVAIREGIRITLEKATGYEFG